jgi:hypothetical protein
MCPLAPGQSEMIVIWYTVSQLIIVAVVPWTCCGWRERERFAVFVSEQSRVGFRDCVRSEEESSQPNRHQEFEGIRFFGYFISQYNRVFSDMTTTFWGLNPPALTLMVAMNSRYLGLKKVATSPLKFSWVSVGLCCGRGIPFLSKLSRQEQSSSH